MLVLGNLETVIYTESIESWSSAILICDKVFFSSSDSSVCGYTTSIVDT